jgi:hypothetical protein
MTRLRAAAAATFGALALMLFAGAPVAAADLSFQLSRTEARAGESVQFSISGTDDEARYAIEVAEKEVAEGSGASGEFTMPNLGATARSVTVKLELSQSGETEVLSRTLQYQPQPPPAAGPAGTVPPPVPATQSAPVQRTIARSPARKQRGSRRPARKRRAQSPARARERHPSTPRRATRTGGRSIKHRSAKRTRSKRRTVNEDAASSRPRSTGGREPSTGGAEDLPSQPTGVFGLELAAPLPIPLATFTPTSAASDANGATSITAVVVFAVLALTGLTVAAAQRQRRRQLVNDDDEVLQGVVHVARSPRASERDGNS